MAASDFAALLRRLGPGGAPAGAEALPECDWEVEDASGGDSQPSGAGLQCTSRTLHQPSLDVGPLRERWSIRPLRKTAGLLAVAAIAVVGSSAALAAGASRARATGRRSAGPVSTEGQDEVGLQIVPTTPTSMGPSLFCFSVMKPGTGEQTLVEYQIKRRASIFACEEFAVISTEKIILSPGNGDVETWFNPAPKADLGVLGQAGVTTNSFLNTRVFIEAFNTLVKSKKIFKHDFLVKVDPDAVFFPDRLKAHLAPHQGKKAYFTNCDLFQAQEPQGPKVFGAVEVYSKAAMEAYKLGEAQCQNRDWHGWGEDYYMQTCMNMLGVGAVLDSMQVGDGRCHFAPCTDAGRAAFHPFKDLGAYKACFKQAIGEIA